MSEELRKLIDQTPEVIHFLRSQIPYKPQMPRDSEGSSGGKPKSKPPLNLDAVDAADLELETLAYWAQESGINWRGRVWRVNGLVRGVLYDDALPVLDMVAGFGRLFDSGWVAPELMLGGVQAVRFAHFRLWPELDSLFGRTVDEELQVPEDGQLSMFGETG